MCPAWTACRFLALYEIWSSPRAVWSLVIIFGEISAKHFGRGSPDAEVNTLLYTRKYFALREAVRLIAERLAEADTEEISRC